MWGSPGTMLAAQLMHERAPATTASPTPGASPRTGSGTSGATSCGCRTCTASCGTTSARVTDSPRTSWCSPGAALLDRARRAELERRSVDVLRELAQRDGDLVQWPATLEFTRPSSGIRTQWCHGAPGIVTSFAAIAPGDDELTGLLTGGGELTWRAGPLVKGPGLCHGTAGNGYAFLKLLDRTGDERWLERARAFGMHAARPGADRARAARAGPLLAVDRRHRRRAVPVGVHHRRLVDARPGWHLGVESPARRGRRPGRGEAQCAIEWAGAHTSR